MKSFTRFILTASAILSMTLVASAQTAANTLTTDRNTVNPNDAGLQLVVCDGPKYANQPATVNGHPYVPCDFNAAMVQVQHLIDIMMVCGVLVAVGLFAYAGYLYVSVTFTGKTGDLQTAKGVFRKTFIGFAIMLCGWFVVAQVLSWLTDNAAFRSLLG